MLYFILLESIHTYTILTDVLYLHSISPLRIATKVGHQKKAYVAVGPSKVGRSAPDGAMDAVRPVQWSRTRDELREPTAGKRFRGL